MVVKVYQGTELPKAITGNAHSLLEPVSGFFTLRELYTGCPGYCLHIIIKKKLTICLFFLRKGILFPLLGLLSSSRPRA